MAHVHHALAPELRTVLEASPDAVLIVNRTGRIIALNRRATTLFATTAERLRGAPVETLLPERVRGAHASARAAYTAAPTVRAMSARSGLMGLRADGTEFPVEVSLTPVGEPAAGLVMAVVHDVTARIRIDARIAGGDRALEALHAIGDAVLTTDADGRVDFLNRSAEELTGLTAESARGRPLSEVLPLVSEASGEPLASPTTACLLGRAPGGSCEAVFPGCHGRATRALDLSTTPIRDSSGAVTGVTLVARDVTHARLIVQQLSHQATHDALTGLVNRSEFERRIARALASASDEHAEHAVCFLDLDGFKRVNDTCGHLAGDELLRQLSEVMRERMRARDTLARLGGDEFGMLLEHCRLPRAERIAEQIRKAIGHHRFTFGAETYGVTASIGIVPIQAGIRRPSDVFRAADAACYFAKGSGGNRTQVSDPRRRASGTARGHEWSQRVSVAVKENRFRIYAQPVVALDHGDSRSPRLELLLRLEEGRDAPLSPRAFLPLARRQGLMPIIDRWVIHEAVRRLSEGQRARPAMEHVAVAINLDDETVTDSTLHAFVREELAKADVRPQALCFEIGESALVAHPTTCANLVRDLRAAGCQTTLEHGGSGMAAFTLLRRLRPDYLKIAGHIVRGLGRDPVRRVLATALNEVGHVLGLKTMAAQVEGPEALEYLRDIGVDYAQGFSLGRPESWEDAFARFG